MVKVRALQACFIGNCLRAAGDVFNHDGEIGEAVMIALEDEAPVDMPRQSKASKKKKRRLTGLPNAVLPGPPTETES